MVVDKDYSALPRQQPYVIETTSGPEYEQEKEYDAFGIVRTSDLGVVWVTGEPGAALGWHSHQPDFYQVCVCLEGRNRWYYKTNEGETRRVDVDAGQTLYLPGGSENKQEVLGDERHVHLTVTPRRYMGRMEYFMADEYPYVEFTGALVYDNYNDRVVHLDEDVVSEA